LWQVSGGLTALRKQLRLEPGSAGAAGVDNPQLANDPTHQWLLRSSLALGSAHDVDVLVRHVGELPITQVPAYSAIDMRYGWRVRPDLELSVRGQNLFDAKHVEFGSTGNRSDFGRAVVLKAVWTR
jgi:iron complex outermembrane receptor protein